MRATEKERIIKKYNEIFEEVEDLDLEDYYGNYDPPFELEIDDDEDDILEAINDMAYNLDYLEQDIENVIDDLKDKLNLLERIRKDREEKLYELVNKYY